MSDGVSAIDVQRDVAVTITFDDGVVAAFPVGALRAACPCATCRSLRERGEAAWPRAARPGGIGLSTPITIIDVHLVGAWGLSIRWNDGHDTGIYSWSVLRRWWDGGLAGSLVAEAD